jgi:hypothetical protein
MRDRLVISQPLVNVFSSYAAAAPVQDLSGRAEQLRLHRAQVQIATASSCSMGALVALSAVDWDPVCGNCGEQLTVRDDLHVFESKQTAQGCKSVLRRQFRVPDHHEILAARDAAERPREDTTPCTRRWRRSGESGV